MNQDRPTQPGAGTGDMSRLELERWISSLAADHVCIADDDDLPRYLSSHPNLLAALSDLIHAARLAFPLPAELSLELYHDPEIVDRYLTLYVRAEVYTDALVRKIEELSAQFGEKCSGEGAILVTTDFQQPQVAHAI
jgi:hypothetical protein